MNSASNDPAQPEQAAHALRLTLNQVLIKYFNNEELRDVCFRLEIDHEVLPAGGKSSTARELVQYCERHNRSAELVQICCQLRPQACAQLNASIAASPASDVPNSGAAPAPNTMHGWRFGGIRPLRLALPVGILALALLAALWMWAAPRWARSVLYPRGMDLYTQGNLADAREQLELARRFDPSYGPTNFTLGVVYEDLGALDQARDAYTHATSADFAGRDLAYNNLGRLLIRDGAFDQAVPFLLEASKLSTDTATMFTIETNLAWARVEQGATSYDDARRSLDMASTYLQQIPAELRSQKIRLAAYYCLSAQVLPPGDPQRANLWDRCSRAAGPQDPDGEHWRRMAEDALAAEHSAP